MVKHLILILDPDGDLWGDGTDPTARDPRELAQEVIYAYQAEVGPGAIDFKILAADWETPTPMAAALSLDDLTEDNIDDARLDAARGFPAR